MSTDWRALCAELLDEVAARPLILDRELIDRARAALAAEPVADEAMPPRVGHILRLAEIIREVDGNHDKGAAALAEAILSHPRVRSAGLAAEPVVASAGPTDDELLSPDQLRDSWNEQADAMNSWDELGVDEIIWWAQCQALARYGHQPAPPAAGEVAELALKELERTVVLLMPVTGHKKIKRFDTIRAALKRLQELENKADLSPTPMPLPAVEVK